MTREEFQNAYGEQWAVITSNPAFFAAMQLVSASKLQQIALLSDEQISAHGNEILADFRGHLGVENALISLAITSQMPFGDLPPETYADPNAPFVAPAEDQPQARRVPSQHFQQQQSARKAPTKRKSKPKGKH